MFSVLFGLLPVIFNFLNALTFAPPLTVGYLFGRGELLLVAVGLSAAALGELFSVGREWEKFKTVVTSLSGLNMACASYYFAQISGKYYADEYVSEVAVAVVSLWMYAVALGCSCSCVALAAKGERDVRSN